MKSIVFENVGKQYRLGLVSTGTISHDLNRWWTMNVLRKEDPYLKIGETNDRAHRGHSDYVWALKDINFSVEQGDVVGIIGKNGAGKSTLLKLLSRVTAPTTGRITYEGRIASLLEVGTGFHPEMTGRENIYMNGAIMGMTKAEITRKLDEIVDFSGCERYIDTPVKRYSSGMTVRLGFAIAAHLEPEILVVDEVLAVGDAEFQKKAIGKMQEVSQSGGRTVLFVSHNMSAVKSLCRKGVVLKDGQIDYVGSAENAVNHYLQVNDINENVKLIDNISWKKHSIQITKMVLNGTEMASSQITPSQRTLDIRIEGYTEEDIQTDLMLVIKNKDEVPMAALAEGHTKGIILHISKGNFVIEKTINLPKFMGSGKYIIDIFMHHPMIEYQLKAINCAVIHIDGYQEGYGRALTQSDLGFYGLETV